VRYRNYLLSILLLTLAFNQVDRLALGLLLQDIKADLSLSDTQLGLLSGIAFSLFYSLMGIPIARWADRGNRVTIISVACALWSAAMALCGFAQSFLQLLLIRIGAAVGEAGCVPPAHSLIADNFSRSERPRAMARYMLGIPLSGFLGYLIAGWLNELYGWRITFILLGLPGLALAALARITLKEPRRAHAPLNAAAAGAEVADSHSSGAAGTLSLKEVCLTLWSSATFRHMLLWFSVASFFGYGITKWQAAFFIRSHGLETGVLGTWFSLIYGVAGFVGLYLGGELASRYAMNNERMQLLAVAVLYCFLGGVKAAVYLSPHYYVAFGMLGLATLLGSLANGPMFATIQTLVPASMRAMAIACMYLLANLIGMGLGPLLAGALSDGFRSWAGEESLRCALLALCPGYLWAAWHSWRASKTIGRDLRERVA
jgi:MFS transporter, Spinster family, sphingosine-1-phosphate transporter